MCIDVAVTIVSVDRVGDHEILVEFSNWTCAVFTVEELICFARERLIPATGGPLGST